MALGLVTGVSDATAFERLGNVFASVITGNLVVLGVSAARGDRTNLVDALCALGGYALGALVAAPARDSEQQSAAHERTPWPRATTARLAGEAALLVAFAIGWELAPDPGRAVRLALLVVLAAAMGTQSVAVRRLGSISTTYLTGTLTGTLEALRARRWSAVQNRDLGILTAVVIGAAAGLEVAAHARPALPALQLIPLAIVLLGARPPAADR